MLRCRGTTGRRLPPKPWLGAAGGSGVPLLSGRANNSGAPAVGGGHAALGAGDPVAARRGVSGEGETDSCACTCKACFPQARRGHPRVLPLSAVAHQGPRAAEDRSGARAPELGRRLRMAVSTRREHSAREPCTFATLRRRSGAEEPGVKVAAKDEPKMPPGCVSR